MTFFYFRVRGGAIAPIAPPLYPRLRLELYKGMVAQSWFGVFFRDTVWGLWCVYQLPSMQFGT